MAHTRLKRALSWRYRRFVQRQGYVVMTVICAAIIVGSAAWTQQAGFQRLSPAPTDDAASAADLWQQSLQEAATPTPAPTEAPALWHSPLAELTVLQGFHAEQLVPTSIAGLWRVHDAVDLTAQSDEPILAMRAGTVLQIVDQGVLGTSVIIDHGDGFVAEYAGLHGAANNKPAQSLQAGELVGYAGSNGLRLRVTQAGVSIDPMTLLAPSQP